uniref:Uncharacterized protein n=1 Tax=Pyxicephalus adspersus TaxID=30357 RepID=A0AAV2ZNX3_PYXAD|nr:TPA: hypothetical protein GDO54_005212 [Pyxicephalus adspersus]
MRGSVSYSTANSRILWNVVERSKVVIGVQYVYTGLHVCQCFTGQEIWSLSYHLCQIFIYIHTYLDQPNIKKST